MRLYFISNLIALDILVNTIFGGSPSQTISGRLYDHRDNWYGEKIMNIVDWIFFRLSGEVKHCERAFYGDQKKRPEVL